MSEPPLELPAHIYEKVLQLSEQGNGFAEQGELREAVGKFIAAFDLLPEPITEWEAATWLLGSIGDLNFQLQAYEHAARALADAMHCPGAIGNPFLHLRLGQCRFELGDRKRAADELTRAYAIEGKDIFAEEDAKYFEFLKTVIDPPASGEW
jgi:tetratricopeptide (TPR) repeat protein